MNPIDIPAQVVRCPKCSKLYPAEQGECPHCAPPENAGSARRRSRADPETVRLRWVWGILFGIWVLLTGALLAVAFFKIGRQGMLESLSLPLVAAAVLFPWLVLIMLVSQLSEAKGRGSVLWVLLSFLIPISPLVSIPLLMSLPSKTGAPVVWKHILGSALSISLALVCLIFVVLYAAMVFSAM